MRNLIECIKINMQLNSPTVKVTNARIKEVLEENNIFDGTSFGKFYDFIEPIKHFTDDYITYACSIGFKTTK